MPWRWWSATTCRCRLRSAPQRHCRRAVERLSEPDVEVPGGLAAAISASGHLSIVTTSQSGPRSSMHRSRSRRSKASNDSRRISTFPSALTRQVSRTRGNASVPNTECGSSSRLLVPSRICERLGLALEALAPDDTEEAEPGSRDACFGWRMQASPPLKPPAPEPHPEPVATRAGCALRM